MLTELETKVHTNMNEASQILAEGLFPRIVSVPSTDGVYREQTGWPYMIAAGNRCRNLGPPDELMCEILTGSHKGIRFERRLAHFKKEESSKSGDFPL